MSVHETAAVPDSRADEVAALLVGAVDLHCHSGPAAMPRVLDHHEAMMDCAAAGFRALLYKDHYYLGAPHAVILEKLFPDTGVRLFSGLVLNNANGGINPHAVDHAASIGAKIIWMPTVSAENHIAQLTGQGKTFPKTKRKMLDPHPAQRPRCQRRDIGCGQGVPGHHRRGQYHPRRRPPSRPRVASAV